MIRKTWLLIAVVSVGAVAVGLAWRQARGQCCGGGMSMTAAPTTQPATQPTTGEAKAGFVNARCPIMGGAIDPAKTPDSLTRQYKGQKVAFCCGGCPPAWDKLTAEEKDAKLKAAVAK